MNNTCLLSNSFQTDLKKRVKSLNKTGLVVIDDHEDIVDGLNDNPPNFFGKKHNEKNNTANVADVLH
jgi:hypothetical protein